MGTQANLRVDADRQRSHCLYLRPGRHSARANHTIDWQRLVHAVLHVRHVVSALCLYSGTLSYPFAWHRCRFCLFSWSPRSAAGSFRHRSHSSVHRPYRGIHLGRSVVCNRSARGDNKKKKNQKKNTKTRNQKARGFRLTSIFCFTTASNKNQWALRHSCRKRPLKLTTKAL